VHEETGPLSRAWAQIGIIAGVMVVPLLAACGHSGNSGSCQAGYDAVLSNSAITQLSIRGVGAPASDLCSYLYEHSAGSTGKSPYDKNDYMQGCSDAVSHAMNEHGN
jgi:hypothetical protein